MNSILGENLSQLSDLLLSLERLLLDPARRADPDSIADLFAEDFREVGRGGRTYNKATILEELRSEKQPDRRVVLEDFRVVPLPTSAALVNLHVPSSPAATGNPRLPMFHLGSQRFEVANPFSSGNDYA